MISAVLFTAMTVGSMEPRPDTDPVLCSVTELRQNSEGYRWPIGRVEEFVDSAEGIVRAVALGVEAGHDETERWVPVRFQTVETLRGPVDETELVLPGRIVDQDDFNQGEVPYQIIRHAGQRGDCYAREYRVGAEYLFLLMDRDGELTPHWAPLAPTNEQLRGDDDPWADWVRGRIE